MRELLNLGEAGTPQSEPLPGQAPNSAGGHSYPVDDFTRLRRFLILGTAGGSYYASERKLTVDSVEAVKRALQADPLRYVAEVLDVSVTGRAPKNDQALLALALAASDSRPEVRRLALSHLPKVARTATHLFHFLEFVQQFRGWGRALRRAVATWYEDKTPDQLAYQVVKYRQRDGWTHRDALRLAHPRVTTDQHRAVYDFICGRGMIMDRPVPAVIFGFHTAEGKTGTQLAEVAASYRLPWEALPNDALDADVWRALVENDLLPLGALLRQLPTLTRHGVLAPLDSTGLTRLVCERLTSAEGLKRARVHPLQVLTALTTYAGGRSVRGSATWLPVTDVIDALDAAFYLAFGSVEPAGKRTMLALDVSESMSMGGISGMEGITPRVGSAAMALVTKATEPACEVMAFCDRFVPLNISPRQRLENAVRTVSGLPFGGTDCALPVLYAQERKLEVDTFIIYTDSETWAGRMHPSVALREYRKASGINAKLVVVGMVSNEFSIADPTDAGMLDVVGFDTAAPNLISAFSRGDV